MNVRNVLHVRCALALGAALALSLAGAASAANPTRPLFGHASGTSSLTPIMQPIPACPADSMWYATDSGTGNLAHLGLVHYTLQQCAAANMATGKVWTTKPGSITIVAANGDHLRLSYDMTATATPAPVPKTAVAVLDWWVTGGTGRFAGATGSGESHWSFVYTPDLSGAVSSSDWSGGSLTY